MDGLRMLKELRNDDWGKTAKVIIITNISENDKLEEAKNLGVVDYLIKTDWKINEILNKILVELDK